MSKKRLACRILFGALSVGWMLLLWSLSAETAPESSARSGGLTYALFSFFAPRADEETLAALAERYDPFVRGLAHFGTYVFLGAFYDLFAETFRGRRLVHAALAFAASVLYAVSDELHQLTVPGRAMEFGDVLRDSLGALTAILLLSLFFTFVERRKAKRSK